MGRDGQGADPGAGVANTFVFFILHLSQAFHTRLCRPSPMAWLSWGEGGCDWKLVRLDVEDRCDVLDILEPACGFLEL